jgi:Family of unknown function (DUF6516)
MKAELLLKQRFVYDDGAVLEMVIWRVPVPVDGSGHFYKYRLFYGRHGRRLIGYDNERPKGDHRHVGALQESYSFNTVEALVRDFLSDVERKRAIR